MIRITIKVSNDHCNFSESFEADEIHLSQDDPLLKSMITKVIESFNQPVDEVKVKCQMIC